MNQLHLFELSEKKVNGTITNDELNHLQQVFAENPELEKDFNENIRLIEELNNHAKYKLFLNNLKKAENTYDA